jgi:hypothetical protein
VDKSWGLSVIIPLFYLGTVSNYDQAFFFFNFFFFPDLCKVEFYLLLCVFLSSSVALLLI